ncbi:MAG TPA: hypothetical protein VE631_01735 [Alphaproteobacteria bacterium]|jgi:hypothetical protein|nr:hypothetical protein [Alphaproteobacteria bacterium]
MTEAGHAQAHSALGSSERADEASKVSIAAAFGLSAAITVVFNVVLAFVKDSWPALNSFMASLTGHHWWTHGLADVILFLLLGWLFMRGDPARKLTAGSAVMVGAAAVIAGGALGLWFLFV